MSKKPPKFSERRKARTRKARTKKALARKAPSLSPIKRVLIVTEGTKTEKQYFEALISYLKLSSVDVTICEKSAPPPMKVLEHAIELCKREGTYESGGYSMVFCVFDRDSHTCYTTAIDKINRINCIDIGIEEIHAITSIPCFEIWFILHYKLFRTPINGDEKKSCGEKTIEELKKITSFSDYTKNLKPNHVSQLISRTEDALVNAKAAKIDAQKTKEENPSTKVDEVIIYLQKLEKQAKKLQRGKSKI